MERLKLIAPYLAAFGLVILLAGLFVLAGLIPQIQKNVGWGLTLAGALLALAWPLLRPQELAGLLHTRQTRYGGNAILLVLAVLAILGAINFLSSKFYYVADLTANKQFTISRQTIQILENLQQPVALTSILSSQDDQTARDLEILVDKYKQKTDKVTYTRLDPQRDLLAVRGVAQRLNMPATSVPVRALVAESGGKHAQVFSFDEQSVTEVVVRATRGKERTIAFSTGHGEMSAESGGEGGSYGIVRKGLEQEGYKIGSYNAAISPTLSVSSTDALIIPGPQRPFLPAEVQKVADYVSKGGRVFLLLDPSVEAGLDELLKPWDILPNNDLAFDLALNLQSPNIVGIQGSSYQLHTITKDLGQYSVVLPNTRSFTVGQPVTATLQATVLLKSSDNAWGETDLEGLKAGVEPTKGVTDTVAPLNLAVAAEGGTDYGRVVVFGTGMLASDSLLGQLGGSVANADLFLNAVNWLTQEEDLISIRPKDPNEHPLTPPTNPLLLLLTTVLLAPLAVVCIGVWIWWQRR